MRNQINAIYAYYLRTASSVSYTYLEQNHKLLVHTYFKNKYILKVAKQKNGAV